MKKNPKEAHGAYEWPYQPHHKKKTCRTGNSNREKSEKNQSEEDIIRSLQGIFCKGRYRAWILSQDRN